MSWSRLVLTHWIGEAFDLTGIQFNKYLQGHSLCSQDGPRFIMGDGKVD